MNSPTTPPRHGRLPIVALLVVAVLAGTALLLWQRQAAQSGSGAPSAQTPIFHTTLLYPNPRPAPEFELDLAQGEKLRLADLSGKWTLLFIGFTHCPDVCPTTLSTLGQVLKQLGPDAAVQVLFVSVDPERDTPERVAEYAGFFDPRIIAATADHARLEPFTRSLGLVYVATEGDGENYNVDHSAAVSIISPAGLRYALIKPPHEAKHIIDDLRAVIALDEKRG